MSHSTADNNILLEVISTRGEMSWDEFSTAFDQLVYVNEEESRQYKRRKTASTLDALGHCKMNWATRKIVAYRPVLARLPQAGCPRVVLTGARDVGLVETVKAYAKSHTEIVYLTVQPQAEGLPDVLTLEAGDEETLNEFACSCRLPLPAAQSAACILGGSSDSLNTYEATLVYQPDAPLNWRQRVFDPNAHFFRRADDPSVALLLETQPRLSEHTNPVTQQRDCRWTNDNRYALVERDWGRYLALSSADERVLLYDARRRRLAVPSSVPLPRLLARAATLCSGQAADFDISSRLEIYSSVPPAIAELVAQKCGQILKTASLELKTDNE